MTPTRRQLVITAPLLEALRNHAQRDYPFEACGFLIGESVGDTTRVTSTVPVANNAVPESRRRAYAIAPQAWMSVEKQLDLLRQVIVGIYHSHPDHSAAISHTDTQALWPELVYLIVPAGSTQHQPPAAWELDDNTGLVRSCPVNVTP